MMASSYFNNFITLHCYSPEIHRQIAYTSLKPFPTLQKTHLHKFLHIPPLHKLHKPNSVLAYSFSHQKEISKFISEKTVLVLLGSFIFMGLSLSSRRPVLAQPNVQETSSQSQKLEEERDTQEIEEGEEMYTKLLEESPKNVEALKGVFYGKMRRGKTKEAVEYVERLIDVEPNEVEWRLLEALCYEMIGELSKAKRLFKDILKRRPLLIRALHGLAMVMHKKLEGPAVFDMLNKALEIARHEKRVTEERNIRILIAQMLVVKGELQDALEKFQELISENPSDFRPYLCQGIIYSLLDKQQEAEEQFMTYRSLVPEEYPQQNFLDDVVIAAKTESRQKLKEEVQN